MANKHATLNDLFKAIANSIRSKKNSTEVIAANNFPMEIENLKTGFNYNNQNVTSISDYEFANCTDLLSVDCPNVESIGISGFEECSNLKSIVLYEGVTGVGENAFKRCSNAIIYYEGMSIPETWNENWNPDNCLVLFGRLVEIWDISQSSKDNVTARLCSIGNNYVLYISGSGEMKNDQYVYGVAWYSYALQISSAVVFDGVTNIGQNAFYDCSSLTSITIPDSVISIGMQAFSGCSSLMSITIPDNVTSIGQNTFYKCRSLTSITIPDNVTSIGQSAFASCNSLTSIAIPDSVTSIGNSAFSSCIGLASVTIGNGVTSINSNAFLNCFNLTSVTIGNSVTSIKGGAFSACSKLTSITYTGTVAQWNIITFDANWDYNTPYYTIYCTDGNIAKDGTITYYEGGAQ